MNRDDVIRWAREADAYADAMDIGGKNYIGLRDECFAALVAAHVRETEFKPDWNKYQQGLADGAAAEREELARFFKDHWRETWTDLQISKAIRARGNT